MGAVLVITLVAVVVGFVCDLLTPFRIGTTLAPVGIFVAVVVGAVLPRLAFAVSGSRPAAVAPIAAYFLASAAPMLLTSGDVLLPGGGTAQTAISLGTILAGVLAGVLSIARM